MFRRKSSRRLQCVVRPETISARDLFAKPSRSIKSKCDCIRALGERDALINYFSGKSLFFDWNPVLFGSPFPWNGIIVFHLRHNLQRMIEQTPSLCRSGKRLSRAVLCFLFFLELKWTVCRRSSSEKSRAMTVDRHAANCRLPGTSRETSTNCLFLDNEQKVLL
jgi:hypothetical protein